MFTDKEKAEFAKRAAENEILPGNEGNIQILPRRVALVIF